MFVKDLVRQVIGSWNWCQNKFNTKSAVVLWLNGSQFSGIYSLMDFFILQILGYGIYFQKSTYIHVWNAHWVRWKWFGNQKKVPGLYAFFWTNSTFVRLFNTFSLIFLSILNIPFSKIQVKWNKLELLIFIFNIYILALKCCTTTIFQATRRGAF